MSGDLYRSVVRSQLGRGREWAEPISAMAERLNLPRRIIENAVQELRNEGEPVASGADGIWLGDIADMEATYRQLRSRLAAQSATAWAVRRTIRRMAERDLQQTTIWEDAA